MVDAFTESEASVTSIERVDAMSQIVQEPSHTTNPNNIQLPQEEGEEQVNNNSNKNNYQIN